MATRVEGPAIPSLNGEAPPEVKTMTFVTLREFIPQYFSEEAYEKLCAMLPVETRSLLLNVSPREWAAETHLQTILLRIFEHNLDENEQAFNDFGRALAQAGINRFMRIFLSLASERFVLRKVPVVWKRLRRNAGQVNAEVEPGLVRLRYEGFPFFGTPTCRIASLANCQALVQSATGQLPHGEIVSWSSNSLVLEFELSDHAPL